MDLPYDDKQAAIYGDSFKALKQEAFANLVLSVRSATYAYGVDGNHSFFALTF